jgi:hypothetical protein
MRRKAGILVLLGMLGGCIAPHSDPEVIDMTATGQAPGSAMTPVGRPRGPAGYQDWAARRSAEGPGGTMPGAVAQGQPGPHGMPVGGEVAALASRATPGSPSDYTAARPAAPARIPAPPPKALSAAEPRQPASNAAVVNSKRIQINYEVKDVGPSGLDRIELWYTHNHGPWQKYASLPKDPPFVIDVDEEGLYGFTLLARNKAGQGKTRPEPNDPPQVAVEVDLTKPAVEVASPQYDAQGQTVTVLWQASDKNLGPQPIALCWARQPTGPWMPIITQIENTGRYVWKLPNGVPSRVWVQVEASDVAGNVAIARTADAVALGTGPSGPEFTLSPAVATQPGRPAAAIVAADTGAGAAQPRPGRTPILTLEPIDE